MIGGAPAGNRHRVLALCTGGRVARIRVLLLSLTLAGALTLAPAVSLAAAGPARAIDNGALGIRPSNGADFFRLRLAPGASVSAVAIVTNHTAQTMSLTTYPVDGATAAGGSFVLNPRSTPLTRVGRWVRLDGTQIEVPARSEKSLPFIICVPQTASLGEFVGGVIIETSAVDGVTTEGTGTATRVDVVHRQGVRIYLTVAADDAPQSSLTETAKPGPDLGSSFGPSLVWPAVLLIVAALGGWGFMARRARTKKPTRPTGAHR